MKVFYLLRQRDLASQTGGWWDDFTSWFFGGGSSQSSAGQQSKDAQPPNPEAQDQFFSQTNYGMTPAGGTNKSGQAEQPSFWQNLFNY